jgi:hypothetical protein
MKIAKVIPLLSAAGVMLFAAMVPANAQLKPIPAPSEQPALLPSEVIIVSRYGVSPAKITRPTGPFVLFIENRLAPHEEVFTLVLQGSTASLLQLTTQRTKPRTSAALNPEPGTYELHFQNNTQLTVDIEVTK